MEPLIWSMEDYIRFTRHHEPVVREWAFEILKERDPEESVAIAESLLRDPDPAIARDAIYCLGLHGDRERHGPMLTELLRQYPAEERRELVYALMRLKDHRVLPILLSYLEESDDILRLRGLFDVLYSSKCPEARSHIVDMLAGLKNSTPMKLYNLMSYALRTATPENIGEILGIYRSIDYNHFAKELNLTLASVGGDLCEGMAEYLLGIVKDGIGEVLDAVESASGKPLVISDFCRHELSGAFKNQFTGVFEALYREAERALATKGYSADADENAIRRRYLEIIPRIFKTLAENPSKHRTQRRDEAAVGIALLCGLYESLKMGNSPLDLLGSELEEVSDEVIEAVADQGPGVVGSLVDLIGDFGRVWGTARAARAIGIIARKHPGSCDRAIPFLFRRINNDEDDLVPEECQKALISIGAACVPYAIELLEDDPDITQRIFYSDLLTKLPTKAGVNTLIRLLGEGDPRDLEMEIVTLGETGSADAIEPLRKLWKSGSLSGNSRLETARMLMLLCTIHEVVLPESDAIRKLERQYREDMAKPIGLGYRETRHAGDPAPACLPRNPGKRSIGKKEKKKRSKARKRNRKR